MSAKVDIKVVKGIDGKSGDAIWESTEEIVPNTGLPVNLIVGQTGTGKTSLIQMMGGGTPTTSSTFADTKHCSLYKVANEGQEYIFLDTVGLLDTASTNDGRKGFITALVKYIQNQNLNVERVFFTVPLGGRQMTEMADWIAVLLEALGGKDGVALVSHWVITKWNQDSKFNKRQCEQDAAKPDGTLQTMKQQSLGFEVITHGEENQEDLFRIMAPTTSTSKGLSKAAMNPEAEHRENMIKQVDDLQAGVNGLNSSIASMKSDSDFQKQEDQLRRRLSQATTDLANCGKSKSKKKKYKNIIDEANQQLGECSRTWRDNKTSKEEKTRKLKELNDNFQAQLDQLRRREGIMEQLGDLVGVKGGAAKEVLKIKGHAYK